MLLGTDPIRFLRQAKIIAEYGQMPPTDMMRHFPVGRSSDIDLTLFPYFLAYVHHLLSPFFPNLTLNQVAIGYPVVCFVIACLILFLLTKELTDRNVALLVISIAIVIPDLAKRSLAGFADRDILSLLFGLTSFLFYLRAYRFHSPWKRLGVISVSGIFMGLLGLTWQGVAIFSLVIVSTEGVIWLLGNHSKSNLYMYAAWGIPMLLMLTLSKSVYRNISEPFVFLAIVVPGAFLALSFCSRLYHVAKEHLSKWLLRIMIFSVTTIAVLIFIILSPFFLSLFSDIWTGIQYPFGTDRLFQLIEELQPKGFFGWIVWPGGFFLAIWGGVFLFAFRFAAILHLNRWITAIMLQIVVAMIILSRVLSGGSIGQNTMITNIIYACSIVILLTGIVGLAVFLHWKKCKQSVTLDRKVIFPLIYLMFMLICARAANRFEFFLVPIFLIIGCYAVTAFFRWLVGERALNRVILCIVSMIVIWELYTLVALEFTISSHWYRNPYLIVTSLFSFGLCWMSLRQVKTKRIRFHRVLAQAGVLGVTITLISLVAVIPSSYARTSYVIVRTAKPLVSSEMQEILRQLRNQSPKNAIVAAFWEWGSAINLIAERATIVDEEQIPHWVYLMSRHVMMGQTEREALQFLKAHQATHLMLTARDIYLLPEISYIGSNFLQDRQISLPVYGSSVQRVESDTGTIAFRYGTLQPALVPEVNSLLPENASESWILSGIYLAVDESNKGQLLSVIMEFQYEERVLRFPPQEIYFRKQMIHNKGTVVPCTILIHTESEDAFEWKILYLSPTARNSLAVRLYLLDEPSEFFVPLPTSAPRAGQFAKVWKIKFPPDVIADTTHIEYSGME